MEAFDNTLPVKDAVFLPANSVIVEYSSRVTPTHGLSTRRLTAPNIACLDRLRIFPCLGRDEQREKKGLGLC